MNHEEFSLNKAPHYLELVKRTKLNFIRVN
jgi:hypothetical protein